MIKVMSNYGFDQRLKNLIKTFYMFTEEAKCWLGQISLCLWKSGTYRSINYEPEWRTITSQRCLIWWHNHIDNKSQALMQCIRWINIYRYFVAQHLKAYRIGIMVDGRSSHQGHLIATEIPNFIEQLTRNTQRKHI